MGTTTQADGLGGLRELATTDPGKAQADAWAWIQELGERKDGDALEALFAQGTTPDGLDGPTDGILVCTLTTSAVDLPVKLLTNAWMPWNGKAFDAGSATGTNRMTLSSQLPLKLLFPLYGMRDSEAKDGKLAFNFVTRVEPGAIEPAVDVLVIDYAPVTENPDLIIRQIRDELVQLLPSTYLGRILFKLPGDRLSNIGYFALKQAV
ncbi:MAG: hypothetical protein QOF76_3106 [Solirubrobacteraceae bacterium]|jgi:hypothetical protein|nr:hypothetical protein [Solirubrobacteraceae bacterium]